jgi:hypothetical protein
MTDDKDIENKPYFDLERAKTMLNKRVLIGLTYYDHKGTFLEQKQMHGTIISVDEHRGLEISLEGSREGEIYMLPPDLRSLHEAKPGEYRERSTREIVINPDFTTTWVVNEPKPDFKPEE